MDQKGVSMDEMWDTIEDIMESDQAYENFRKRTKKFMVTYPMTYNQFSIESGVSATIFIAFVRDGYRRLSLKTISKIIRYMDNYEHDNE